MMLIRSCRWNSDTMAVTYIDWISIKACIRTTLYSRAIVNWWNNAWGIRCICVRVPCTCKSCSVYTCSMCMARQFPDRGLDYTTPHKYSNVWWQVIMWLSVTCLRDRNSVRMVSCTIGNSIMCNATVSSTGVNSTAVTAHVHWQTVLMTTCSIDARYVAVRRQFPDSFIPFASNNKRQGMVEGYCVRYFHQNCRQQ